MRYTISLLCASLAGVAAAHADVPVVVTDIPPVHSLTALVMGDLGSPVLLLDRGGNPHEFQLRPSQAAAIADAQLVVWVGPEMTPWLDRTLDSLAGGGARLELLEVAGITTRAFGDEDDDHHAEAKDGHDHDAAKASHDHGAAEHGADHGKHDHDKHDHDKHDHDGHDHDGHDHDGTDPHAWLNPDNAQVWLAAIAAELSRLDPANAATYAANATAAEAGIAALDADLAARLEPIQGKPFVVFHDAYGYLADHYGLNVAGSVLLGDAASPGAARLRELQTNLAAGSALCIFPEANHDPKLVGAMADGTDVRIGGALDPAGSIIEPGPGAYAALLSGLADTLIDCLAVSG